MSCPPWPARNPYEPPRGVSDNGRSDPSPDPFNPSKWGFYELPAEAVVQALREGGPPNVYYHDPKDGPIQVKPQGPRHCVICRSHNQGDRFWEHYVGRKGERRVVWLRRPVCSKCGAPWVSVPCEGGHD